MIEEWKRLCNDSDKDEDLCRSCKDFSEQYSRPQRVWSEGAGTGGASEAKNRPRDVICFKWAVKVGTKLFETDLGDD